MKNVNINMISFHDGYVIASCNEIQEKLQDEPIYILKTDDPEYWKTHIKFNSKLDDGTVFSIYDYKLNDYNSDNRDEIITFHIGTHTAQDTIKVVKFLKEKNLKAIYDPYYF
jgi:hypothetical protein